jgi:hypothetical protein
MTAAPDRCHVIDDALFRDRRAEMLDRDLVVLRDMLVDAVGKEHVAALCGVLRPRVAALADSVEGDFDGPTPGTADGDKVVDGADWGDAVLLDVTVAVTLLTGRLVGWWMYSCDAPAGVGMWWWRAQSLLEAADDLDVADVVDRAALLALESHLSRVESRVHVAALGGVPALRAELVVLSTADLVVTFTETAEDAAQLVLPLGGTALLDALCV